MRAAKVAAGVSLLAFLWCVLRRGHAPRRHPLGAFKCEHCGVAGSDMGELGYRGSAYVAPVRPVYDRTHGDWTRTSEWEPARRGRY